MIPKDKPAVTLSNDEIRAIQEKARTRQALREYIIKERANPYNHISANGKGYIEDIAFVRYEATRTFWSEYTHFKATPKTTAWFLLGVIGPMFAIGFYSEHVRGKFDRQCRNGEIAYKDRNNKFI